MFPFPAPALHLQSRISARQGRAFGVALASLILSVCFAGSAQGALISSGACNEAALSQPFLKWGDTSSYELVPGGDFEGAPTGWTLSGEARRTAGSESYGASGTTGSYSLALPSGASAESPYTCVNASYPTFRFFARANAPLSTVLVTVIYKTALGTVSLPLGVAAPGGQWQPTLPMLTGSVVGGLLSGGTAEVALRFTSLTGSSNIDDVFIDPRMK